MKLILIILFIGFFTISNLHSDSIEEPKSYITTSENGAYFFIMSPAQNDNKKSKASGKAYQINNDGSMTLLWKVEGWYAYRVILSDDGKYLLRMGDWPLGCTISSLDLAVSFYKEGKLLKRYSTADLIMSNSSIRCTSSHYMWLKNFSLDYNYEFNLETIEHIQFVFDIKTGKILNASER